MVETRAGSPHLRVLGLVPARGGSKGVPGKNLALVLGKPLLQYTAEAARAARTLARVVLSTDDAQIAAAGRAFGLETPFLRPAELARDETPMFPVVQHALVALAPDRFDAVLLLQPTSPLRRGADIDGAVALLERTGADSVIAVVDVGEHHPARMKSLDAEGRLHNPPFAEAVEGQRRQELPKLYLREGSIYLTRTSVLLEQGTFQGRDCRAWIVPPELACNVDEPHDLLIAEALLRFAALDDR